MQSQWNTRELVRDDQDLLWELAYIALWDPPTQTRRPRSVLDDPRISRLVENWGREDDFGLVAVAFDTGVSAGAIWARLDRYDQLEDYGCPYPALGIAILPNYQELGAGSTLLAAFIESLRLRVDGLRLGVHPDNKHAKYLYEKYGFAEYATGAGEYPQMKLDLS